MSKTVLPRCPLCNLELTQCLRGFNDEVQAVVLVCVCCDPAFQSRHEKENCPHSGKEPVAISGFPLTELETLEG